MRNTAPVTTLLDLAASLERKTGLKVKVTQTELAFEDQGPTSTRFTIMLGRKTVTPDYFTPASARRLLESFHTVADMAARFQQK